MVMDLGQRHLLKRRWALLWGYEMKVSSSLRESTLVLSMLILCTASSVSSHLISFHILNVALLSCKVVPTALLGSAVTGHIEVVIHETIFRLLGVDTGCLDDVPSPLVSGMKGCR